MDEESSSTSVAPPTVAPPPPHQPSSSDSSTEQQQQHQQQQTTSTSSTTPATSSAGGAAPTTSDATPEETSTYCRDEAVEFGYTHALPFAPWRRKRYGLTVLGLHEEIVDMFHWIKPNEIESRLRTKVYEKVRASVLRKWSHKKIKISMFGSLRTNLFLPTSDIDVLVECDDWTGTHISQQTWLQETADGLKHDDIAETVMVYGGAFVPIVKMVDRDTRLSIDISFNTVQGVRAASYITKVKEEFPLIEPLVLLLKQFLHYRNLNQTFTGGLSSYGLVLLLVNFFQLHAIHMRHRTIYDRGVNLGHLLLRFLELYSLEFNHEEVAISCGQACYLPKSVVSARNELQHVQLGNLTLEDPLLTANDVGRSTYNFSSIANAFGQALQILMVAVTLRERKGQSQSGRSVYRGSLLHLIMPFSSKELGYRTWLMSSALQLPRQEVSVKYDLNQLHNTLVSPIVDLSKYAWLRTVPIPIEKDEDVNGLQAIIKKQVLDQLREQLKIKEVVANGETTPTAEETKETKPAENLSFTGPPMPVSTASVNTSATVSTAASVSERDDTDSPGLSCSLGMPSSEDDDDDSGDQRKGTSTSPQDGDGVSGGSARNGSVQFKKPFNEVVAAASNVTKEHSKRTQTNFDERKMSIDVAEMHHHGGYVNGYNHQPRQPYIHHHHHNGHQHRQHHYQNFQHQNYQHQNYHQNGYQGYRGPAVFVDYAAVAAMPVSNGNSNAGGRKQPYGQRNHQRHARHSSQGSNESDGYQNGNPWSGGRWNGSNGGGGGADGGGSSSSSTGSNQNGMTRGRARNGRGTSASSAHSRHSSGSRSRGRGGFPAPASLIATFGPNAEDGSSCCSSNDNDATLTGGNDETTNTTITSDSQPRMYADAVKKNSTNGSMDAMNGNSGGVVKNVPAPLPMPLASPVSAGNPMEVSYRNIVAANIPPKPVAPSMLVIAPPFTRKDNDCAALIIDNGKGVPEIGHLQPQLVMTGNRIQR